MAELVLGPMLRHVSHTSATIWVEVDGPCEVEVLGRSARTFTVEGFHYALVMVEGLEPGMTIPYEVALDGITRWPLPDSELPPSVIRTSSDVGPHRLMFGSCRTAAPHEPPWSLELADDPRGRGADAMRAHGLRMLGQSPSEWPEVMVMLGDQVYADESSPKTRKLIAERRPPDSDVPEDQVAGFEEYCWLYHESWSSEIERWFFSVVPSAMIFDDHDMVDDWNISSSWVDEIRREPWWREHVVGGLMSYWIYQHLGNLSPDEVREEGMLAALCELDDGTEYLRKWAEDSEEFAARSGGYQFSHARQLGNARLVVIDSRNGRVLQEGDRAMLDEAEWDWVARQCAVPCTHLLIATSLPVFVPGGLHDLQRWNEAVCGGAWGRRFRSIGERIRRGLDLEDWPAFSASFDQLVGMIGDLGARADAPASITVLSGDIHFSYLARVQLPDPGGRVSSALNQVVASPMRNALRPKERAALRVAMSRFGRHLGRALARLARLPRSDASWEMTDGPIFANSLGQLVLDGSSARVVLEQATDGDGKGPELHVAVEAMLTAERPADRQSR